MKIKNEFINCEQLAQSGQTFRWYPTASGYIVVANHQVAHLRQEGEVIHLEMLYGEQEHLWRHYLDLDRDYGEIHQRLQGFHPYLDKALAYGKGIRVLNQDPYEMIMTFIISANNNIVRITNAVDKLARDYGDYLCSYEGIDYYDFPSPAQLEDVTVEAFRACGVGYRDRYLYDFVQAMCAGLDLESYKQLDDVKLKSALLRLKGVGEKVANCIMLFGYQRTERFPIDTWMKKILIQEFHAEEKDLQDYVKHHFKFHSGIAQQYLFYYGRMVKS